MTSRNEKGMLARSVIFLVIFGSLTFWSLVAQDTLWGTIYTNVFYFLLAIISLHFVIPSLFEYSPINADRLDEQIIVGFALGFALVGGLFISGFQSFLSPLSIPDVNSVLGILGVSSISQVFVLSIVISELEEGLRSAALRPTVFEWLGRKGGISTVFLIFGFLIFFIIEQFRILGLALVVLGTINFIKRGLVEKYIKNVWVKHIISWLIVASFFSLLHFNAYFNPDPVILQALLQNAFIYAVVADFITTLFKGSTISSRIGHTFNNAALASIAVGITVWFAVVVAIIHAFIMVVIATGEMPKSLKLFNR